MTMDLSLASLVTVWIESILQLWYWLCKIATDFYSISWVQFPASWSGLRGGVEVKNSYVNLPQLPGIGFEGKADLIKEMRGHVLGLKSRAS